LGPIIGHRTDHAGTGFPGVKDAKIIEAHAKKLNNGSDEEYLSVEIFESNT